VPFFTGCSNRIFGTVNSVIADPVGAMNDIKADFAEILADRRKHPRDESTDFATLLMNAKIDDRSLEGGVPRHLCDTCVRVARHDQNRARLVVLAPGHPPQ
jgi:hypothetical protein